MAEETVHGWTFGEFAALEETLTRKQRRARALVAATMSARERIEERLSIFPVKCVLRETFKLQHTLPFPMHNTLP